MSFQHMLAILNHPFALAAAFAVCSGYAVRELAHMFQLESYQLDGFFRWLSGRWKLILLYALAGGLCVVGRLNDRPVLPGALIYLVWGLGRTLREYKKPLVWTARAKRLMLAYCALTFALMLPLGVYPLPLIPLIFVAAAAAMHPVEEAIKKSYFKDAKRKLAARPDLIRVGITGSYGKTSAKFILGALLEEKYNVLVTPASFNTPMGLTRVIREKLAPEHQVFIAEMGARHVGEIAELCDLVKPTLGVLISVGPQHLETFGSLDNVKKTKYELIDALPDGASAVFAADGGNVDDLFRKTSRVRAVRAGLEPVSGLPLAFTAEDIAVTPSGSRFTLVAGDGSRAPCETRLLGRHNIQNIVVCAAAASALGLTLEEIARGAEKIQPVEHRLQLIPTDNGVTVIDDAFNSNPAGTRAALAVIAAFPGRKIVVTPGMVELGESEAEQNRLFGEAMADVCDIVVLVGGDRTRPMRDGLTAKSFPEENIHAVPDLAAASALLAKITRAGDVLLFENDLPDNYAGR